MVPLLVRSLRATRTGALPALASFALMLGTARTVSAQSSPAPQQVRRSIAVTYTDRRPTTHTLRRSRAMWTPLFPSVPGRGRTKEGLPVAALEIVHQVEGDAV